MESYHYAINYFNFSLNYNPLVPYNFFLPIQSDPIRLNLILIHCPHFSIATIFLTHSSFHTNFFFHTPLGLWWCCSCSLWKKNGSAMTTLRATTNVCKRYGRQIRVLSSRSLNGLEKCKFLVAKMINWRRDDETFLAKS